MVSDGKGFLGRIMISHKMRNYYNCCLIKKLPG